VASWPVRSATSARAATGSRASGDPAMQAVPPARGITTDPPVPSGTPQAGLVAPPHRGGVASL
jgi:hypothetical protein